MGQQYFITDKGYMGMGNPQVGDKVFVLIGSDVPFVLRSSDHGEDCFFVVGDCYVHGIMDGELLSQEWHPLILR